MLDGRESGWKAAGGGACGAERPETRQEKQAARGWKGGSWGKEKRVGRAGQLCGGLLNLRRASPRRSREQVL